MNKLTSSIRRQLLTLLIVPILILWGMGAFLTYVLAINFATNAFDAALAGSAKSVADRLNLASGKLQVDLPPAALAILRENKQDKLFFQVLDRRGRLRSGDDSFPAPPDALPPGKFVYWNGIIDGLKVRIATVKEPVGKNFVTIQVAETLIGRTELARNILIMIAVPQLLLILLCATAVWLGVSRGLRPLKALQEAVQSRTRSDLRSLSENGVPIEVLPLVQAINDLLARLRADMQAQERFIANAAHQLRTPLAGLKTQSELALRQDSPTEIKHAVKQIQISSDRAARLANQLLVLARVEPDNHNISLQKAVDLNKIAREASSELVPESLEKDIDLGFEESHRPAMVTGDPASLHELISNLIENAIRYTPSFGKVTVRISVIDTKSARSPAAFLSESINDKCTVLTVEDNGPGIPEHERERIFERFYRVLGTQAAGSGLGLAIVQEIADTHNANISVSDGPDGKGTTVQVTFPFLTDKGSLEYIGPPIQAPHAQSSVLH